MCGVALRAPIYMDSSSGMDVPWHFAGNQPLLGSALRFDSRAPECLPSPTMFENRSLKLDVCALALVAIVIFLAVALWSYHPTDPPSTLVWPRSQTVDNACGRAGA